MRLALLTILLLPLSALAQAPNYTHTDDVIYGRKFGTALTMDVFIPKVKPNGTGVIFCVSGGWYSSKDSVNFLFLQDFLNRGYACFAVMHGSQPKYTIPEILEDQHRAVRFIRTDAKKYGVDPERLGISGASAGGHLSLMQGTAPKMGDPKAKDPVERESSKVAAVACLTAMSPSPTRFVGAKSVKRSPRSPTSAKARLRRSSSTATRISSCRSSRRSRSSKN